MKQIDNMKYTMSHKKAYLQVERKLLGRNTIQGYFHDLDKIFLYLIFDKKMVAKLHRGYSRHHNKAYKYDHYLQMVIDWECARLTKLDKPLNARETLNKYFSYLKGEVEPILDYYKL